MHIDETLCLAVQRSQNAVSCESKCASLTTTCYMYKHLHKNHMQLLDVKIATL